MKHFFSLIITLAFLSNQVIAQGGGSNDANFNVYDTPSSINGGVSGGLILDMLSLPNGKLIIAGTFKKYNDIPLPGIARLNADGSLDQTFNTGSSIGGDSIIKKVKLMADGRLLILGKFTCTQGSSVLINLARLNNNGDPDLSFNPVLTGSDPITDVAIQANGDILVVERFDIYKLNSSGTLIQSIFPEPNTLYSFNPRDGSNQVLENADGSVYIVGNYTNRSLNFRKILPDGTVTNIPGIDVFKIWHAALQPDGKLLLFGSIYLPGDPVDERRDAVRLNTNGTVDNSFHFSFTGNKPANYLSTSLSDVAFMTGNRMLLSYANQKIFFYDGCVSNCNDDVFIFTPQCANPPCPCIERLDKLIYQVNENGSAVTSDTLNRFEFGGNSFDLSIDRMFMQNNHQLLVAGRFSYGTCPNSTAIPKNGFCRINLTFDEPCLARDVVPAAAGLVNCSNAVSGNLTNATVNGYASCSVNKDLWYSFTATNITHQIRVTGNGDFRPSVTLYNTGVCSSLGTGYLQCISSDDPGGTATITRRNLEIGGRYYLKISYAGTAQPVNQTFDICILTPINDEPCNAIEVTPNAPGVSVCTNPVNGDVQVASFNNLVTCTPNNPDVWYKFTATSTSHVISIAGNNLFEPAFAVFAASNCVDVALPAIFCAEGPVSTNGTTYGGLAGLTVGATYYIKVSNASSNSSASTTFSICVLTPVNDEACTAAILTPGLVGENTCSNPVTGNMLLATSSGIVFGCNGTGASGIPDLWYKFVATNSGHLIRVEGLSGIRLISLYSSNDCNNPGVRIQCNSAAGNTASLIAYNSLVSGNTYYVRINQSVSGTVPDFSICLLMPAANNEPCGAVNLISAAPGSTTCSNETFVFESTAANEGTTCVGYNVLWYKFTASQTSHFLKMTGVDKVALFSAASCNEPMTQLLCKGTSCLDNMKQFSMKNLVVGTIYYLAVGGGGYNICLLSVDNDEPCTATPLGNCSPTTSDLSLATNTLNTYCNLQPPFVSNECGFPFTIDAIQPNDLWYSFTATSGFTSLIFNRVGTGFLAEMNFNLQLSTITDCQNPVVSCPTSSNRLITGSPLIRTFATVIGQTYYLSLSNADYDIPFGGGGLSIELRMGNSAVSITQDPAGSVCEGSTISFTANPTNGGSNPQFTWQVNNVNVSTGPTFSSASLQDNDVVTCLLTSSNCVAPPTVSSSVTMDVYPIPTWYVDADGDGFGDGALPNIVNCIQPNGYVNNNTDCNDANASVFPGSVSPRIFRSKQNGNWQSVLTWEAFDGCSWTPGLIPSSTDSTIIIMHDVTVTGIVNADQVVVNAGSSLIVSSGNFILNDGFGTDLVVNGIFNLSSNMSGNGTASIAAGGQFNWENGNFQSGSGTLLIEAGASATFNGGNGINQGRSLINNGIINWLGGQIVSGDGGSFINNHIIDIVSDINVNTNCSGCPGLNFTNASSGVITKTGGSGVSVIGNATNMIFNNDGVVNFNAGTIIFRGQGTHSGTFNIPAGQSLRFEHNNNVTQNFNNGSSLQGSGSVQFINGIINFNSGSSYASTLPTMITGAYVFWNMVAITINDFTFTDGRVHGTAEMTFPGTVIWSGGDWRGDGTATFTNTATVTFNGGGRAIYEGRNIINNAVITWSSGDLVSANGGTFTNNHIIDISDNINVNTNCTGCPGLNFTNASTGVITKSGGTGSSVMGNASNMIFNNDGILNINSGNIIFRGQGTHNGTFNIPAGQSLRFEHNNNVTQNFNNGSSLQGSGSVLFINGIINFNSGSIYASTLPTMITGAYVFWNMAALTINDFTFTDGRVHGTAAMTFPGTVIWSGGDWRGDGTATFTNTATVTFNGGGRAIYEGRNIINNAVITWSSGDLVSANGGTFTNNHIIDISDNINVNTNCTGCPGLNFTNASTGVITKSGGSGSSVIGNASNMIFNNDGILNINSGNVIFRGQGNHTGTFNIPPSRILRLEQNGGVVQNFNSGASMQGAGTVAFINGNTNFNSGCLYAPTLGTNHSGGTLNWNAPDISINSYGFFGGIGSGTGVLNILQSLHWSGGEWRGSGQTVLSNAATGNITGSDKQLSEGRLITNNGNITWDGGNLQSCAGGFFVNNGLLSITNNNSFLSFCSGNPGITISNNGTIERTTTGTTTFNTYSSFSNTGTIKGLGTFRFENTSLLQNGKIAPGNPIGLLSLNGRQPFSSGSTLEVQFANGTSSGTDHDQFSFTGDLTLNGTLTVIALGFVPIGTYTIITVTNGTISGNFSAVNLPVGFSLVINSTTVDLVRTSPCLNPTPVITASGPLSFCPGGSVVLTSSAATGNIWSNGATTQSVTVSASETFTVSNTDINGCISLPSTAVTVMIGFETLFYADTDGDGFGDPLVTLTNPCGTLPPVGFVSNNNDCNDASANLYPNVSPGIISGTTPLLVSQTSLFTASGMSGGNWSSSDPQIATIDPISGMVSAIATGNTTISYTIPTCTGTETVTFDLSINPNISAGVVSGPTSLCIGATAVFTSTGTPGGTWSSSNTAIATVDPVSGLVTAISGGSANIIYTVGGTVSASATLTIIFNPVAVINPGAGTVFCIGEARSFNSNFNSGGNWSSSNTAVATVSSNGMVTAVGGGVANIVYTSTNTCGVTATASAPIRVIPSSGTTVITGPVNVCGFVGSGIPVKYVASLPGISIFNWTVPPNVTIVSGQFTDTLTVTFAAGFTAQANKQINCSPSIDRLCNNVSLTPATLSLFSQLPGTPSTITSSLPSVCRGDVITLRIPKVPGATIYDWVFLLPLTASQAIMTHPNGLGENDTLVQVTFTNNFLSSNASFTVRALNQCGASSPRSIVIAREIVATPSLINGPSNVCGNLAATGTPAIYSVTQQPGITSYNWILPPGIIDLTGQGTNTISFKYPAGYSGGSIAVQAINRCGTSSERTKAISVLGPSAPGGVDVIQVASCPNRIYTYSLAAMPGNATAVNWTVPVGATLLSGQGTISIAVSYPSTIVAGNITAQASNNCGVSSVRTIRIKLPACAPVTTKGIVEQPLMVNEHAAFDVQVYPNPTADYFRIKLRSGEKEKIIVQVYDLTGRRLSEHILLHEQTIETGQLLKPGAYIIKIIQGKNCIVRKVIKQ